jgi:SAM-dependent methyltransferase
MLESTGERFIPGEGGAAIFYEHAHRYRLAQSLVANQRVADLASGEGYGSDLLAERAALVVGLEIDAEAVAHATKKYRRDNLHFVEADIRIAPLRASQFDLVVCFEAIEHITRPEVVLAEARRILRPDGVLVISTPERKEYSDSRGFKNKFHEHEFYQDEFRELLEGVFPSVEIFGQRVLVASALWPLGSGAPLTEFEGAYVSSWRSTSEANDHLPPPQYCIAVCGGPDAGVQDRLSESMSLLVDPRQAYVEEHDRAIEAQASLEYRVLDLETYAELLLSIKDRLEAELAQATSRAQTLTEEVRGLHESTSWRITRPVRALSRLLSTPRRGS